MIRNIMLLEHNYRPASKNETQISDLTYNIVTMFENWISPDGRKLTTDQALDEIWEKEYCK